MSKKPKQPEWYLVDGVARVWDGETWLEHKWIEPKGWYEFQGEEYYWDGKGWYAKDEDDAVPNTPFSPEEPLARPGARFGSYLLEGALAVLTLGVGWLIWSLIAWAKGTTPGHQILKQYVVNHKTGETFGWSRMLVREFLVKGLLCGLLYAVTVTVFFFIDSVLVFGDDRRSIHDRISGSVVVQR